MNTVTVIPTSAEALENVTAGNSAVTVVDEVIVGEGDHLIKVVLTRYDWRDCDGAVEVPDFCVAFRRGSIRLDWAEIPAAHIDSVIAALVRLRRAWVSAESGVLTVDADVAVSA